MHQERVLVNNIPKNIAGLLLIPLAATSNKYTSIYQERTRSAQSTLILTMQQRKSIYTAEAQGTQ